MNIKDILVVSCQWWSKKYGVQEGFAFTLSI